MRSPVVAVLALAGIVLAEGPAWAQRGQRFGEPSAARYGWLFSLSAGKQKARETGKPLMVVLRCVP
jgi:hypothetical protein